jgi:hypothetical protein
VEKRERKLEIRTRLPGKNEWRELLTYRTDPSMPPCLHSVRDASGRIVLTEDRPKDPSAQYGLFTEVFPRLNGIDYGTEGRGRHVFARLLDLKEGEEQVSWRALAELVAPDGRAVLEEEQAIAIAAPHTPDSYTIDFHLVLRAKDRDVAFGKSDLGGLAVRLSCDPAGPRPTYLNANGLRGRACHQSQAAWCTVKLPKGDEVFGIALLDHPGNANYPPGWRLDELGLLNPSLTMSGGWSLAAGKERAYRYRIVVYKGTGRVDMLRREFAAFATAPAAISASGAAQR